MLIFIDLETTGLEADDKIVSIGIVYEKDGELCTQYELINEGKKIPPKASSIHHITKEMLKGKVNFKESDICKFLEENNSVDNTLVAHNIKFDLEKLSSSGFTWKGGVIDTLRVTKHLIPECELFSLQVLKYELQLYKLQTQSLVAHNALDDAHLVKLLYKYLEDIASREKMEELSFKHVLLQKIEFGKYAGKYLQDIAINDRSYLEWMLSNMLDLDEDLRYSIIYNLEGNG